MGWQHSNRTLCHRLYGHPCRHGTSAMTRKKILSKFRNSQRPDKRFTNEILRHRARHTPIRHSESSLLRSTPQGFRVFASAFLVRFLILGASPENKEARRISSPGHHKLHLIYIMRSRSPHPRPQSQDTRCRERQRNTARRFHTSQR